MTKNIKEMYRKERIAIAKAKRLQALRNDHKTSMIIRKMDSSINRLKDYNQKHPKDMVMVPKARIHKLLV